MNKNATDNPSQDTIQINGWFTGTLIITFFRLMLGAWMIVNGLNHLLPMWGLPNIYPQPLGTLHLSNVMLVTMIETGLFDYVKVAELLVGLCLVFNRFVPLALVIALPLGLVVFYNSIVLNLRFERIFSFFMAVWCTYMNIVLLLAYIKYYIPMLQFKAPVGKIEDLRQIKNIFGSDEQAKND
ncbi:DoxX family protein [Diaphorobacter sp. HDW4A]|uniref:DoxX family protein n=1 Tax=Diaphorobacter sp. HDW4A TaxID=2714924 RepID=UPI001F0D6F59|nr:DoxX family protein [Diaphorobacter sp. HDW4A]